jgi:serine protease AprX
LEYLMERRKRYGIRIVNLSVGTLPEAGQAEKDELVRAVERVWDAGLVVVAAAGNNGPDPMSITTPGISRKVITVGSSEKDKRLENGRIARGASSRGPTPFCVCKPDILAPGRGVLSCRNGRNGYIEKTGTSMSTAVVSGAAALLLEKKPWLTPAEVKLAFYQSAVDMGWEKNRQGWGMLDVKRLLSL